LWEYAAAVEGWKSVHAATPKPQAPSDDEFEAAVMAAEEIDNGNRS
jgi:hypothetical protein